MFGRQFVDEAAGQGGRPLAIHLAVGRIDDVRAFAGTGDAHIGQPPFFLQRAGAAFVH